MDEQRIIAATRRWLQTFVVEFTLCPFAAAPLQADRVRFAVSAAASEEALLNALVEEINRLDGEEAIETTLLIHPAVLTDFFAYNDFLDLVDHALVELERDGVYQVASFHPRYQFAGTRPDAAQNYTNRSPYPMLHLLREASVESAISSLMDPEAIPDRNIERMESRGTPALRARLARCFDD